MKVGEQGQAGARGHDGHGRHAKQDLWGQVLLASGIAFAVLLTCLGACSVEDNAAPATRASTSSSDRASHGLIPVSVEQRGRLYTRWAQESTRLELRLERPQTTEAGLMLCVPGTYTGPDDQVEGVVIVDGKLRSDRAKTWAGLLEINQGRANIRELGPGDLSPRGLETLQHQGASLMQGHLLVHTGTAQPFVNEPKLARRAIVIQSREAFVVESQGPVGLGDFAKDLASMGASEAMNLDMGKWSEGWVRVPGAAEVRVLGEPDAATERQSNWLVFAG